MKTKLLIILFLFILCAFFAACSCSATGEREIIKDMHTSREGVLSSGREFEFHGADQVFMTIEQFLEEMELGYSHSYDFIIQEETIESMLERPEWDFAFATGHLEPDAVFIFACYFPESNDVLFRIYPNDERVIFSGYPSAWVVNHESGVVSFYTGFPLSN
jgi:hypothetical protein